MAAEHGCYYRHPATAAAAVAGGQAEAVLAEGWVGLADTLDRAWRATILPLFRYYTERTPGAAIDAKETNITWHYHNADPEFGAWQASELQMCLGRALAHLPIAVRERERAPICLRGVREGDCAWVGACVGLCRGESDMRGTRTDA
jgi:trehalose 6-phosphate synthase/phosphatase